MDQFLRSHDGTRPRSPLARAFGAGVLSEESDLWYRRALGELGVGELLATLDSRWTALHALPQGDGHADIDHLLIGPAGVLCIRTIDFGRPRVSAGRAAGTTSSQIRDSEFSVGRVERALGMRLGAPVKAVGVIVVVDPRSLLVRDGPRDVVVIDPARLTGWLESLPHHLDAAATARLVALAERPDTWLDAAVPEQDGELLRLRFDGVHRQVRSARAARRLWAATLGGALLGVVLLAAWGIVLATLTGYSLG